jgi:hypothetical protein
MFWRYLAMSIKVTIALGPIKTEATLKDSAYTELVQFCLKHHEGSPDLKGKDLTVVPPKDSPKEDGIQATQEWLSKHTASEALNRIAWKTNPEKILLLAAFSESNGGEPGWKSADIEKTFEQAKEGFPSNFPRDIRIAIDNSWIGAVTSRTYRVGRAGWSKIGEAIKTLAN